MRREKHPQLTFIFSRLAPATRALAVKFLVDCEQVAELPVTEPPTHTFPSSSVFPEFTKLLSNRDAWEQGRSENKCVFTDSPHYQLQSYSVFPAEFVFIAAFRIMPSVNTFLNISEFNSLLFV